jgi:GAF domain-containing protein
VVYPTMLLSHADAEALLRAAETVVRESSSLEVALRRLCLVLAGAFPFTRASVETVDDGGERVTLAGVWSSQETVVRRGASLHVDTSLFGLVHGTGCAVRVDLDADTPLSLLYQLLAQEGNRACMVVPLRFGSSPLGALSLSTDASSAFSDDQLPFFEELGERTSWSLLHLAFRRIRNEPGS